MSSLTPVTPRQKPPMTSGPARDPKLDDRIIAATLALVAEHGYGALRMEKVAAAAGVSKATLYRRWGSREDLISDALDCLSSSSVDSSQLAASPSNLRDDLVETFVSTTGCLRPSHHRVVVALVESARHHPELSRVLRERVVRAQQNVVLAALERAADRGEISTDRILAIKGDEAIKIAVPTAMLIHFSVIEGRDIMYSDVEAIVDHVLLPILLVTTP